MNMRKLKKDVMAVSPVIATLMLVLVSVGAAGALYMWQAGWQESVEDEAGDPTTKTMIRVGGSSTVYEFSTVAKELFELANPSFKIDLQKGGSTSGVQGCGWGLVDIGASSSDPTSKIAKYNLPDFDRDGSKDIGLPDMVSHLIGYDGVVVVISDSNGHGLTEISPANLTNIYDGTWTDWSSVPVSSGSATNCSAGTINVYDRAEHSGTEECFVDKILDDAVGTDHQMNDPAHNHQFGNQNLKAAIAADPDGIGFVPFGMLDDTLDEVAIDGATATSDDIKSGDWIGSRGLYFVTVGEPSGATKRFVDYCKTTELNQEICGIAGYVSIFD